MAAGDGNPRAKLRRMVSLLTESRRVISAMTTERITLLNEMDNLKHGFKNKSGLSRSNEKRKMASTDVSGSALDESRTSNGKRGETGETNSESELDISSDSEFVKILASTSSDDVKGSCASVEKKVRIFPKSKSSLSKSVAECNNIRDLRKTVSTDKMSRSRSQADRQRKKDRNSKGKLTRSSGKCDLNHRLNKLLDILQADQVTNSWNEGNKEKSISKKSNFALLEKHFKELELLKQRQRKQNEELRHQKEFYEKLNENSQLKEHVGNEKTSRNENLIPISENRKAVHDEERVNLTQDIREKTTEAERLEYDFSPSLQKSDRQKPKYREHQKIKKEGRFRLLTPDYFETESSKTDFVAPFKSVCRPDESNLKKQTPHEVIPASCNLGVTETCKPPSDSLENCSQRRPPSITFAKVLNNINSRNSSPNKTVKRSLLQMHENNLKNLVSKSAQSQKSHDLEKQPNSPFALQTQTSNFYRLFFDPADEARGKQQFSNFKTEIDAAGKTGSLSNVTTARSAENSDPEKKFSSVDGHGATDLGDLKPNKTFESASSAKKSNKQFFFVSRKLKNESPVPTLSDTDSEDFKKISRIFGKPRPTSSSAKKCQPKNSNGKVSHSRKKKKRSDKRSSRLSENISLTKERLKSKQTTARRGPSASASSSSSSTSLLTSTSIVLPKDSSSELENDEEGDDIYCKEAIEQFLVEQVKDEQERLEKEISQHEDELQTEKRLLMELLENMEGQTQTITNRVYREFSGIENLYCLNLPLDVQPEDGDVPEDISVPRVQSGSICNFANVKNCNECSNYFTKDDLENSNWNNNVEKENATKEKGNIATVEQDQSNGDSTVSPSDSDAKPSTFDLISRTYLGNFRQEKKPITARFQQLSLNDVKTLKKTPRDDAPSSVGETRSTLIDSLANAEISQRPEGSSSKRKKMSIFSVWNQL